jgi:hypothetical protein
VGNFFFFLSVQLCSRTPARARFGLVWFGWLTVGLLGFYASQSSEPRFGKWQWRQVQLAVQYR